MQLLQAFAAIFATGRREITSQEVVDAITADPTSRWVDYNRGGPIAQRKVAHLLERYDISRFRSTPQSART